MAVKEEQPTKAVKAPPVKDKTDSPYAAWSKRKGWPMGSCRYCGRLLLGPSAPASKPVYSKGYEFCSDIEAHIYERDGCLSPEKEAARDAVLALEKQREANMQREVREREARQRALEKQLRTL